MMLFGMLLVACSQDSNEQKIAEENNRGIIEFAKVIALDGGNILSEDWGIAVKTKMGHPSLNFAFVARPVDEEDLGPLLKKIHNFYQATRFEFWIDGQNMHLASKLTELGYTRVATFPGLAMPLNRQFSGFKPQGVVFTRVTTEEQAKDWVFITSQVHRFDTDKLLTLVQTIRQKAPYVSFYLAYHDGKPVSSRMMIIYNKTVTGYFSSTLPDYRGRGVASNLLSYSLTEAKEKGVNLFAVQAISGPIVWKRYGMKEYGAHYYCYVKKE